MHHCRGLLLAGVGAIALAGCGGSGKRGNYPPGQSIPLLEGTAHLGDNRAADVIVRKGLGLGAPPPSLPPSRPWGVNQ